jgi:Glutamate dehydrogenase/leucine dehydrogenase
MSVFSARDFDDHEQVIFCSQASAGLKAIIAIHNTNRGPALGGCRMWPYRSEEEALRDVLRLSRAMTYKAAISNLDVGGGKSVIIGDPRKDKSETLFRAMGRAIGRVAPRYIAAEDSGTSAEDLKIMAEETPHVVGIMEKVTGEGGRRSGDPSPITAYGTFLGLRAAVKYRLGREDLAGIKVALQGVGHVGYCLAKHLHEAGAKLWVSDIYQDRVKRAVEDFGATAVGADEIYSLAVDVFAPCALGGVINDNTVNRLHTQVVAGPSNNQLAEDRHGKALMERGILYAPDYVINAGGIIDVFYEHARIYDWDTMLRHVEGIYDTLMEIFKRSRTQGLPTNLVADQMAEARFKKP